MKLLHSFLIASAASADSTMTPEQQIQVLEDDCVAIIKSSHFDDYWVHPDQSREEWIVKWTPTCESQSAQLKNAFQKGSRGGRPLCGQPKP